MRRSLKTLIIGTSKSLQSKQLQLINCRFRLEVISSGKFVTAQLVHFENGPVVEASTKEWCIKKQLYKTSDTSAYVNLAQVFAKRCLMSGLIEMTMQRSTGLKIEKFIAILKENGLTLEEPAEIYTHKEKRINRFLGRRMTPKDWKEIVVHH